MSTVTKTTKARQRTIKLALPLNDQGKNGVVTIAVGKEVNQYYLSRIPADWGQGFLVEKISETEDVYQVNIDGDNKTCTCKGHTKWGRCKHADGLAALQQAGKL